MKPSQKAILEIVRELNRPKLLDFGSKTGSFWEHLEPYADVYGCDISLHQEMAERIKCRPEKFRLSEDPETIPYEDNKFDIIFANSVFEHVEPLEKIIQECARVLKSGGRLISVFPTKTVIVEPHVKAPFASLLCSGHLRKNWLEFCYRIGFGKDYLASQGNAKQSAAEAEAYLTRATYYRYYGEHKRLLRENFQHVRDKTDVLLRMRNVPAIPGLSFLASRFYAVCFEAEKSRM